MTISQSDKIDILAVSPDGSEAVLVIVDDLEWSAPDAHEVALQDKVNT